VEIPFVVQGVGVVVAFAHPREVVIVSRFE
jgi:hypothetical protein